MYDLVIKGGQVVDGTGAAGRTADIAVAKGLIVEVGRITGAAARTIDADGLVVTPGFVDIHTHYDGQATWDSCLDPSFSAGVTTAMVGNCGVGFAPIRRGDEQRLIDLMDGVEEIPGSALHAGLKWNWSSFGEYLNVLDSMPHSFDIAALLPHGPLRLYVLGDKVGTDKCATGDELARMTRLVDAAMSDGAFGLSTSRTAIHRTVHGDMTPDFNVDEAELLALAEPVTRHGGYLEFAPTGLAGEDFAGLKNEMAMYDRILRKSGANMHLLVLQTNQYSDYCREQITWAETANASGRGHVYAQIGGRPIGALLNFFGSNPFKDRPTFQQVTKRPKDQWVRELSKPDVKARILSEQNIEGSFEALMTTLLHRCYDLGEGMDYEPDESRNVVNIARSENKTPLEAIYDLMVATTEKPRVLMIFANYSEGNLDALKNMLSSPSAVLSLSDAGAHVMSVCDGAVFPFMLTHWTRDRTRGARMPLERVVRMMTLDAANSVDLRDRGVLACGYKADINVIDMERLNITAPRIRYDLPEGASRLMQTVSGFRATVVSGRVTREHDRTTNELPGRLVRHRSAGTDIHTN